MPAPQDKLWNLSHKTASATYEKLQCGVGKPLTDRRIEHYRRNGFYGEAQQLIQLEQDERNGKAKQLRERRGMVLKMTKLEVDAIVDDLIG